MFKKITACILALILSGCNISPFSPEQTVKTDGNNNDVNTVADSVMTELGNIKNKLDIQGSQLRDIQEGLIVVKGGDNNGTQIFSGDGGLIALFSISVIGILLFYFYKEKKANTILASEITKRNDTTLHENIIKAAAHTSVESKIYNMLYKP